VEKESILSLKLKLFSHLKLPQSKEPALIYQIDLKKGQGDVNRRKSKNADAVFTMTDGDFDKVCNNSNISYTRERKMKN